MVENRNGDATEDLPESEFDQSGHECPEYSSLFHEEAAEHLDN
jgi:hypothetical protein